jgi:hypothetical protein
LLSADRCSFFNPPTSLMVEYPDIEVARNYDLLHQFIQGS